MEGLRKPRSILAINCFLAEI